MNKKIFILGLAMVTMLCGCAQKTFKNEEKKTTVTIWYEEGADLAVDEAHRRMIEEFCKSHENIEVVNGLGGEDVGYPEYLTRYDKALMSGVAPTMADIFSYTNIPTRINNKTVADITDLYEDWEDKDLAIHFFDDAISKNGRWYAVPRWAYIRTIACKTELYDKCTDIKTWDEFLDGAASIKADETMGGYLMPSNKFLPWLFTAWIWNANGDMVSDNGDGTYEIKFNSDAGVKTVEFLRKLAKTSVGGTNNLFEWRNISVFNDNGNNSFINMPVIDENTDSKFFLGGEVVTFNPRSSKDEIAAAWELYKYWYFDDSYYKMENEIFDSYNKEAPKNIQIPAKQERIEDILNKYNISGISRQVFQNPGEYAKMEPYCKNWNDLKLSLEDVLTRLIYSEGVSQEDIKSNLDSCVSQLYTEYPNSFKIKKETKNYEKEISSNSFGYFGTCSSRGLFQK